VCPYLLNVDVSQLPAPLAQFQSVSADRDGTLRLVEAVNRSLREGRVPSRHLPIVFKEHWKRLKGLLERPQQQAIAFQESQFEVLDDPVVRTRRIVADLKNLYDGGAREAICYSGYLSAFAISDAEEKRLGEDYCSPGGSTMSPEKREAYHKALLEERDMLLQLARKGWPVRCIITPLEREHRLVKQSREKRDLRIAHLMKFLQSEKKKVMRGRKNIEWVVSPFGRWNIYIIGQISCFEGFKRTASGGFDLTLRQSSPEAIAAKTRVYDQLFRHIKTYTLTKFPQPPEFDDRLALEEATLTALNEARSEDPGENAESAD
jgi:hypothetical protein